MANQTVTSSSNILAVTAGLNDGENITINSGAVLTFDVSPDKLIGQSTINDGKYLLDGANSTNPIIYCGEQAEEININGAGILESTLGWWEFPTLGDGTASQTFDCSTYYSSDPNNNITADVFSGVWIETGRRIDYDNGSGIVPVVYDWCFKTDGTLLGRIAEVSGDGITGFIVLEFMFGILADNDAIELHTNQDNFGSDYQKSWNALVNNASGDIFHADVWSRWGNLTQNNTAGLPSVLDGFEGMGYDQPHGNNTLSFGDGINGLVVPNSARIRVPMVHFCTATTTSYALGNTTMAGVGDLNRHNIEANLGGEIDLHGVSIGSAFFLDANASKFVAEYIAFNTGFGMQNCGTKVLMNNIIGVGDLTGLERSANRYPLNTVDLINGCQIDDVTMIWMHNGGGENGLIGGTTSFDLNYKRAIQIAESNDLEFNKVKDASLHDLVLVGNVIRLTTVSDVDCSLFKVQTRFDGSNTTAVSMINCSTFSDGITIKGWEILKNSGVDQANITTVDSFNIKVRGFHFVDDPYIKSSPEEEFANCGGISSNIDLARCFTDGQSNPDEFVLTSTTCKDITVSNCSGDFSGEIQPQGTNIRFKGVGGGVANLGTGLETDYVSSFGNNVLDYFRSTTTGSVGVLFMPESPQFPITDIVGNPKFTRDGDVDMINGDSFIVHSYYSIRGHTAFTGVFTTSLSTGNVADGTDEVGANLTIDFQYDIGSGFNGTWLDLKTPANLTGITGMVSGIEMKFRFTATGTINAINGVTIHTNTTLADQKANFHPIDQNLRTISMNFIDANSNPITGYEYRIYESDPDIGIIGLVELAGEEIASSSTQQFSYVYSSRTPIIVQGINSPIYEEVNKELFLEDFDQSITIQFESQGDI